MKTVIVHTTRTYHPNWGRQFDDSFHSEIIQVPKGKTALQSIEDLMLAYLNDNDAGIEKLEDFTEDIADDMEVHAEPPSEKSPCGTIYNDGDGSDHIWTLAEI